LVCFQAETKTTWDFSLSHHSLDRNKAISPYLMPLPLPPEITPSKSSPRPRQTPIQFTNGAGANGSRSSFRMSSTNHVSITTVARAAKKSEQYRVAHKRGNV